jgi:hypothetical protein
MFTTLFNPAESGFALLKTFGTLANLVAFLVLLVALAGVIMALVNSGEGGSNFNALVPALVGLVYVPLLLLLGQVLHWMAAMYSLRVEANRLLAARQAAQ